MSEKNQKYKSKPIVGISIGDINGIGPEVIIKALKDNRLTKQCTPVIYANGSILSYYRKVLNDNDFNFFQCKDLSQLNHKKVNVINSWNEKVEITPGIPNETGGQYAVKSLEAATSDLKNGNINALVTAPLSKEMVQKASFEFPGHTEYLANVANAKDSLMMMILDSLRIAVVTGHIALEQVPKQLSPELISLKLSLLIKSLKKNFDIKKPKVAVLGLNPHAGENGKLGTEDNEVITPVIDEFKNKGDLVFGPFPADGFFGSGQHNQFDAVLAMYHDQGLIPFKILSQGEGVNFTAGLPFVRTSPAHGTAYNLAGKNLADPTSFLNAIFAAIDLSRKQFSEISED
jgi:4-hydroxythreonine-4-phosphate dehydrogenase